jgi:hypothetical protein
MGCRILSQPAVDCRLLRKGSLRYAQRPRTKVIRAGAVPATLAALSRLHALSILLYSIE